MIYIINLTDSYGFLLGKVLQQMEENFAETLKPAGIGARQYGVLLYVKQHPNSSQKEIGEKLQIDRTTMVSHIDHLEKLGYVTRIKNTYDRRAYNLLISQNGEEILHTYGAILTKTELDVLSNLNHSEKKLFKDLLQKTLEIHLNIGGKYERD